MNNTNFLNKYKGVTLTCKECKNDFRDDRNKLSMGKTEMCIDCNIKSMGFKK